MGIAIQRTRAAKILRFYALLYALAQYCAMGGDAPHQPAPKFRPRIQGDDFKDERIFASRSARALRAASA